MPYLLENPMLVEPSSSAVLAHLPADIDGDGLDEFVDILSGQRSPTAFFSSLIGHRNPQGAGWLFQYNGPYSQCGVWSYRSLDVIGGPGAEIIMTKNYRDTVFFEMVSFNTTAQVDTTVIVPIGVGRGLGSDYSWRALHALVLGAIDLNADGNLDLIFSRSAKPDSALERGVVAYDVRNDSLLWFYPTADGVSDRCFQVAYVSAGNLLLFATNSTRNRYTANGMDSNQSYLVCLDAQGHELWRRTIGASGYYPQAFALLGSESGATQIVTALDRHLQTDTTECVLVAYDISTGNVAATSPALPGLSVTDLVALIDDSRQSTRIIAAVESASANVPGSRLIVLDRNLTVGSIFSSLYVATLDTATLLTRGDPEIVATSDERKTVVFDGALRPLAWAREAGEFRPIRRTAGISFMLDQGQRGFSLVTLTKQSIWALMYARYKWAIAVVLGMAATFGLYRFSRWIAHIRLLARGAPTLDKISAMTLMLDGQGRITYANESPLTKRLIGDDKLRHRPYENTSLATFPALTEIIRGSLNEPLLPVQGRLDAEDGRERLHLDVSVYPRVDDRNTYLGKIVVLEDVGNKVAWERKAVLGDAAQRWIHRLKGNMATARITLENLREDARTSSLVKQDAVLEQYLKAVADRIQDSSRAADKILRFVRIGAPDRTSQNLNHIVESVVNGSPTLLTKQVTVAKILQSDIPPVAVDREQMTEVLDNLLSNSLNAVAEGGNITVSTFTATYLLDGKEAPAVGVAVEDNGSGIPPEDLDRIFDPGFSRSRKGTGIGLAIVKEIVENHGGSVDVTSWPGKGSRFVVIIPLKE